MSSIAIPDQIAKYLLPATSFGELISYPFRRWAQRKMWECGEMRLSS
jgi:hypothetical protein